MPLGEHSKDLLGFGWIDSHQFVDPVRQSFQGLDAGVEDACVHEEAS